MFSMRPSCTTFNSDASAHPPSWGVVFNVELCDIVRMTAEVVVHIPTWDEADRIRKAMRDAGLGVQELADALEVSRTSVSNWINGRTSPRDRDIRAIARMTAVPPVWLRNGESPDKSVRASRHRQYTPWDSNPEPTDLETCLLIGLVSEADAILRTSCQRS